MAASNPSLRYRFSSFELQLDERRLLDKGIPVPIGPRAFDLLAMLARRAGKLVSKDELLAEVWPKVIVEEAALQMQISSLRKILGRDAIATVTGSGYRLVAEATCFCAAGLAPKDPPAHNLPQSLSSFVGREAQVSELQDLLHHTRLLTLVGSGGCGKTRLALRIGAEVLEDYPDGVWFVELAALSDPQLVPMAVGHALALQEQPGLSWMQALAAHLHSRQLLIVLDNAEHLLTACAEVSHTLLSACAGLRILATSRERLGIFGETTYRIPALSVPDDHPATPGQVQQSEAGRLFIERARLQQPDFAVTPDNMLAVASICRELGGIPLAIELAAARTRQMPVEEICRRLVHRFELLTGGSRVALPRHRTLRAMIDWSFELLSPAEQALFCRVSLFSGGWTLAAAEQVCAEDGIGQHEILDLLTSLTDKSLLLVKESVGETRYELLETVRHYARERLCADGIPPAWLLHRHFQWAFGMVQQAERHLSSDDQHLWLERLEAEHDNLRAALQWARRSEAHARDGLHLASSLGWFWSARGHLREARQWLALLLAAVPVDASADLVRGYALRGAANLASQAGDYAASVQLSDEALLIFRRLGDRKGISHVLNNVGTQALDMGDCEAARPLLQESMEIKEALGDHHGLSNALANLGELELRCGNYQEARALLERGLDLQRSLGNRRIIAHLHVTLGVVLRELGDFASARARLIQGWTMARELKHREIMALSLEELAALAAATHQPANAAALWGRAAQLREQFGLTLSAFRKDLLDAQISGARLAVDDDLAFDAQWRMGQDLPLEAQLEDLVQQPAA